MIVQISLKVRSKHNCLCADNSNKKRKAEHDGQQLSSEYGVILIRYQDLNKVQKHTDFVVCSTQWQ